jgi:hypothetical protein
MRLSSGWHTDPTEDSDPWGYVGTTGRAVVPTFKFQQIVQCAIHGKIVRGRICDWGPSGPAWFIVRVGSRSMELHVSRIAPLGRVPR